MITLTREEAQQVLDAFLGIGQRAYDAVSGDAFHECSIAVSRLRARLSAPEPEPVTDKYLMEVECTKCGAKQDGVLTVTVPPQPEPPCKTGSQCIGGKCPQCVVSEPVAWMNESDIGRTDWKVWAHGKPTATIPLYPAPPQREEGCAECGKKSSDGWALYCVKCSEREWQGLTDEEIKAMWNEWKDALCLDHKTWAQAIEAKLREKNNERST